jgi:hypothetical protein
LTQVDCKLSTAKTTYTSYSSTEVILN